MSCTLCPRDSRVNDKMIDVVGVYVRAVLINGCPVALYRTTVVKTGAPAWLAENCASG